MLKCGWLFVQTQALDSSLEALLHFSVQFHASIFKALSLRVMNENAWLSLAAWTTPWSSWRPFGAYEGRQAPSGQEYLLFQIDG
jgi:hypothetical protein